LADPRRAVKRGGVGFPRGDAPTIMRRCGRWPVR